MKLIGNTYRHFEKGFCIKVVTCNKKIVTVENIETYETTKFNRSKFEWMVNKYIFLKINND